MSAVSRRCCTRQDWNWVITVQAVCASSVTVWTCWRKNIHAPVGNGTLVVQSAASHVTQCSVRRLERKASHPPRGSADITSSSSALSTSWLSAYAQVLRVIACELSKVLTTVNRAWHCPVHHRTLLFVSSRWAGLLPLCEVTTYLYIGLFCQRQVVENTDRLNCCQSFQICVFPCIVQEGLKYAKL